MKQMHPNYAQWYCSSIYADVKAKILLAVSWIIINILMVIGKKEKPITMCYVNLIYWGYIYACHDLLLEYQNIFIVIYLYSSLDILIGIWACSTYTHCTNISQVVLRLCHRVIIWIPRLIFFNANMNFCKLALHKNKDYGLL